MENIKHRGRPKIYDNFKAHQVEYNKEYYNKHREHILDEMYKKKHCDKCNRDYTKCNFDKHLRSNKHKNNSKII